MDMMDSSSGSLAGPEMGKWFWSVVGTLISIAMIFNIIDRVICAHRLRLSTVPPGSSKWALSIAKPKNALVKLYATITAIGREIAAYYPIVKLKIWKSDYQVILPSAGRTLLIAGYFSLLLGLFFYQLHPTPWQNWETAGYRAAGISMSQIPLLFALSGKVNLVGILINASQEELCVYHRWVARGLLFTTTLHMGFFMRLWGRWDYIKESLELAMYRYGLAAWCVLGWIVISSFAPLRNLRYEFFIFQHIASIITFIVLVFLHIPTYYQFYMWISIGFWIFDRLCRFLRVLVVNKGVFFMSKTNKTRHLAVISKSQTYIAITIESKRIKWKPGQYVYLNFPTLAFWQSHPFTVMSVPTDDEMKFLIYPRGGLTHNLKKFNELPVIIDGPYGSSRDFKQFDTVILAGAGSGISYLLPIARDIIQSNKRVVRRIRIVWVIRTREILQLIQSEILKLMNAAAATGKNNNETGPREIQLQFDVYITCQDLPSSSATTIPAAHCGDPAGEENICMCTRDPDMILPVGQTGGCCCCGGASQDDDDDLKTLSHQQDEKSNFGFNNFMLHDNRPPLYTILSRELEHAVGESGVACCGPSSFASCLSNWTSFISDERAVHKGTGAQGIYLHTETFSL